MNRLARYVVSLPERIVRTAAAVVGGAVHETAQLLLPRLIRRSRLYEVSAKNLLRILVEGVGAVEGSSTADPNAAGASELAVRKGAGNVVELGSILAFGFSPLWLLAAASDVTHGSRVYLRELVEELKAAGVVAEEADIGSVDELLGVFEGTSGRTARLIDLPRPPDAGRAGGPVGAGGLERHRARIPALGAERVTDPPRGAVPRGLAAAQE